MAKPQSFGQQLGIKIGIQLLKALCHLPAPIGLGCGKLLGLLTYLFSRRRRQICETNLRLAFPDLDLRKRDRLCRHVFIENGRGIIETGWAWWAAPQKFWDGLVVDGLEHLQDAQSNPKGTLLIGGHFSALDLGGLLFAKLTERFSATYRPHNSQLLEKEIQEGRGRFMDLIDRDDVRTLFRTLDQGKTVWFAPDQDLGRSRSVFVPFFGISAATNPGMQKLAKRGATPLVIGFHRNEDGNYHIQFLPWEGLAAEQNPIEFATVMNKLLEQLIRKKPAQYMWMHRRFKTRPEGEVNLYSRVVR